MRSRDCGSGNVGSGWSGAKLIGNTGLGGSGGISSCGVSAMGVAGVGSFATGAGLLRFNDLAGGFVGVSLDGSVVGEGATSSRARVRVDRRGSDMMVIDARGRAR